MESAQLTAILLEWSMTFIRLSQHDFNRYMRSAGLSLPQMTILLHLHYRGPSDVTHICEMMQVTPAGASQMIERMAQQGMVRREEWAEDRRVRLVNLTEKGREVVLESIAARQTWIEALVAGLSPAEAERIGDALLTLNQAASKMEIRTK
jgi:MarR family 2-MHQ and catechol resistance regulon transcriptional repressor